MQTHNNVLLESATALPRLSRALVLTLLTAIFVAPPCDAEEKSKTITQVVGKSGFERFQKYGIYAYQIREFSKGDDERLTYVDWPGNLGRFTKGNNKVQQQEWLFIPDGDRYRLMSMRTDAGAMPMVDIRPSANIFDLEVRAFYVCKGQPGRSVATFKPTWVGEKQEHFQLIENTKNEYVTIHYDGTVVRWADMGGKDVVGHDKHQVFQIASRRKLKSNTKLVSREPEAEPGRIAPPPKATVMHLMKQETLPETTPEVRVGEEVVSALQTGLFDYQNKMQQINASPFYTVTHTEYWDRRSRNGRGDMFFLYGDGERKTEVTVGVTTEKYSQFSESLNINATAGGTLKAASGAVTIEYSKERNEGTSETHDFSTRKTYLSKLDDGTNETEGIYVIWSLVDKWEIKDWHGQVVRTIEVIRSTQEDRFAR